MCSSIVLQVDPIVLDDSVRNVHPSLPGSRMPVLRILTVDEKFGLEYSGAQNIDIGIKEHLIKITPKLIIDHLSWTISIASNGRIPGFFSLY